MFGDLLIPIEHMHLKKTYVKDNYLLKEEVWQNVDKDFSLVFEFLNQTYRWTVFLEKGDLVEACQKSSLPIVSVLGEVNQSFYSRDAAFNAVQQLLKRHLPDQTYQAIDWSLKRRSDAQYLVLPNSEYNENDYYVFILGHANEWKIWFPHQHNYNFHKQCGTKTYKTKRQALIAVRNILSNELFSLYDKEYYSLFKHVGIVSPANWWALFVKPEIDLTKIF